MTDALPVAAGEAGDRPAARVLVLGCGNLLAGDDGVGPEVVRRLTEAGLPPDVKAVDGGTLGLDLLPLLDGQDLLVLVDAVDATRLRPQASPPAAGTVSLWEGAAVARAFAVPLSVHEVAVADLLGAAMLAGRLPAEVALVGVQPHTLEPGVGLSPDVNAAVPAAMALVGEVVAGRPATPPGSA